MVTFSKSQKETLEHYIINSITCQQLASLMKNICCIDADSISVPKEDAKYILDTINSIRDFILKLPREGE